MAMRVQGPGKSSPSVEATGLESGDLGVIWSGEDQGPADAPARPFVERRRRHAKDHDWQESLESLQRHLTRLEEGNQLLGESESLYRGIFENALIGLFRVGLAGEPLIVNRAMAKICGYDCAEQFLGQVTSLGEPLFEDPSRWAAILRQLHAQGVQTGIEVECKSTDGERKWIELNMRVVRESGRIVQFEGSAEEITDRKRSEERIRLLAYYDLVTGLPNRPLFEERLGEALSAARWKSQRVAVMALELNRFRMINDSLGKDFGDRLLQETAGRIRSAVGESTTVARIAGAEFAVILQDVRSTREVEQTAAKMVAAVTAEFSSLENSINVTCNAGISMFPVDGWDGDMLLERADAAMYSGKDQSANSFRFFTEEIHNQIRERLRLENGLRLALERGELFLVYQAQVDIRTGDVSGLEALLRWNHPEMGLVYPSDFISVAESSGLIVPIGEWVLHTACRQARKWQDAGLRPVPVAVNVSAIQFRQQGFCETVRRALEETGLDPKYLELELTEGLLLTNADVMYLILQELREMGVKLTIDDFGTGYSSLGYLRQFKVNRLKIDRSFVREVSVNADDAAITTAIINMAKALNLDVLAEGVENVEQLDFLRTQNCFEIQGYYFSRPVTVEKVELQLKGSFAH